jgi:uncharacterized membrane protein YfcA
MVETSIPFLVSLLIIAALYSSVGHGGASGYLALLALYGCSPSMMKSTALLLNVFVSLIAFIQYYRTGNFQWKLLIPLVITSVPAAFIGGTILLNGDVYKKVLGVLLVIAAFRFIYSPGIKTDQLSESNLPALMLIGAVVGLLSGMIGIGGGIILTPILLLLNWANVKQAAGVSALFIFVNSVAGLGGKSIHGLEINTGMALMLCIALAGGFLGSYIGSRLLVNNVLKRVLAVVLLIASIKLLLP